MLCDEPPLPRLCVYICPEGNFKSRNLHFDRPEGKNKETAANNSCTNWPVHCVSKVQSSTFRKSSSGFSFCFKPTCFAGENISAVPLKTRLGPPHLNFSMTVFPPFRLQTLVPLLVQIKREAGPSKSKWTQRFPGTLIGWRWQTRSVLLTETWAETS